MAKKTEKRSKDEELEVGTGTAEEPTASYGADEEEVSDNMIPDLITGESIKLNEKELICQEEERKLLEEFGYEDADFKDLIRREVSIKPKQAKRSKKFPLIVLQGSSNRASEKPADRAYILFDIQPKKKPEDTKAGSEALAELLRDIPSAQFAVWTNGTDRVVYFKKSDAIKIRTLLVNDIPRYGKTVEDSFEPGQKKLRKAVSGSLRQAFQRCHNYIYAMRGGSNEAVFWELLKIVFAKIEDERTMQTATPGTAEADGLFRLVSLEERNDPDKAKDVKQRVTDLYNQVRSRYPELFGAQVDKIDLPPRIIVYLVSQLGHYDFLGSSVDVKGEAYEAIVGKNLEGTRGEFFTPRNAVKMAIRILDPKPGQKCIDPACGTGGFITVILNYIAEQIRQDVADEGLTGEKAEKEYRHRLRLASQNIFGLDINPDLVRVARMNMVMNDDGQGGITHLDGLEMNPDRWELPGGKLKRYQPDGSEKELEIKDFFKAELQEGTFDIIATNPPFGTKIKYDDEDLLGQYEGVSWKWNYNEDRGFWSRSSKLQGKVAPEILFIERVVRLLKPGTGKACMVLPNGILGNPDDEYIRQWLLKHTQILALVAMPVELFLPKVGIQTHLVFFRRKSTQEMNQESIAGKSKDYDIFMAIAKKVGKDRRANVLFKRDPDGTELTHFRDHDGRDLHEEFKDSGVFEFLPEVDEYGRMVDDDLPFIADAYHQFLKKGGRKDGK
jgi:type I restriction enzyme M protein